MKLKHFFFSVDLSMYKSAVCHFEDPHVSMARDTSQL